MSNQDGLKKYAKVGLEIGSLVDEKNEAYGSSFSDSITFFKLLYPNGIRPDQYGDALLLVRIFDKQKRIATKKDAFGESPFKDIAGYGILGASMPKEVSMHAEDSVKNDLSGYVGGSAEKEDAALVALRPFPEGVK